MPLLDGDKLSEKLWRAFDDIMSDLDVLGKSKLEKIWRYV